MLRILGRRRSASRKIRSRAVASGRRLAVEFLEDRRLLAGWGFGIGGDGDDRGHDLAVDAAGNVHVCGVFQETVDFDPGQDAVRLTSRADSDGYVAKYDQDGQFVYVAQIEGTGNVRPQGIATDAAGGAYVAGWFKESATFGSTVLESRSSSLDIFVAKLDDAGNYLWAVGFGGPADDMAAEIAVDAVGGVYVTGYFKETVPFGDTELVTSGSGDKDVFAVKLDAADGTVRWARQMGSAAGQSDYGLAIAAGDGHLYLAGTFDDPDGNGVHFGDTRLIGAGMLDGFVAKLDASDGTFLWAERIGGEDRDQVSDIALGTDGSLTLTGEFRAAADFGPHVLEVAEADGSDADGFVTRIDADGNFVWAKQFGGLGADAGSEVSTDADGNAYTIGYFHQTCDVDPGPVTVQLAATYSADALILKLDAAGNYVSVWHLPIPDGMAESLLTGIDVDGAGNVYAAGRFAGTAPLPNGPLTAEGLFDAYVLKLVDDNGRPSAVDDAFTVAGGATLEIPAPGVLDNDEDPESAPLMAVLVSNSLLARSFQFGFDGSFVYAAPYASGIDTFTYKVSDGQAHSTTATVTITVTPGATIAGRHVFYNNSAFDGSSAMGDPLDDAAVADKEALAPGSVATFANYTNYSRGINGLMVDVEGLSPEITPGAADFEFRVGNDDDPAGWAPVTAEPTVTLRRGAGTGGSDRVTVIWNDGAIRNTWLQVTVKAAGLEMADDDVFYFGNAVAEAGDSEIDAKVTAADLLLARNNPRDFQAETLVDFPFDYDRDGQVDATDVLLARNNRTSFLDALQLIDLSAAGAISAAELAWLAEFEATDRDRESGADAVDALFATFVE